ncbi:hypothetical protein GCM10008983_11490 [Lentibacillus halophilus]|uniref:Uncharacterized protein n=1 Tax=Lentibacillus halophilus TaxID=295065 RepID=A0ABN0Z6T1_9BACI
MKIKRGIVQAQSLNEEEVVPWIGGKFVVHISFAVETGLFFFVDRNNGLMVPVRWVHTPEKRFIRQ